MRPKLPAILASFARDHARAITLALAGSALLAAAAAAWWILHPVPGRTTPGPDGFSQPVLRLAARPTEPVTFEQGCVTSACHTVRDEPAYVHLPADQRACNACHAPDAGGHTFPLLRPKPELCTACHDTGLHKAVQHQALTAEGCLGCHAPHGGPTRAMLKSDAPADTCASCHPRQDGPVRHPPYADRRCDLCHDSHGSDAKGLLRGPSTPETCQACHASLVSSMQASPHSHLAVPGSCQGCHTPHAGEAKALLKAPTARDTCIACHADIGAALAGASVPHDAVLKGEQCIRCHDPHASDRPHMLRDRQSSLCLSCHDKPLTAAGGRLVASMASLRDAAGTHAVDGHRECSGCHSVHGGTHQRLLRDRSTALPLGPFDRQNFALCSACHDPKLAEDPAATWFRDGDRNLHALHLAPGDKSRGCSSCHSVHALGEPRLIAKTVNFEGSGWNMPMGFVLTQDGGRCGSGCHEALEYSRRPGGAAAGRKEGAR